METLVISDGGALANEVTKKLRADGIEPIVLRDPNDKAIQRALETPVERVAVVARDDIVALRLALVVEHFRPGIELVVTVFDRTIAGELQRSVPRCRVVSLADIVAPSLAAPCIEAAAPKRVGLDLLGQLGGILNPTYAGARILIIGLFGLLSVFLLDAILLVAVLKLPLVDAIYGSARTITTVAAEPEMADGPDWLKLFSALTMLLTIAFAAMFTAGLVQRLIDPRLTTIIGRRSIPMHGHVIVIGLGQVGLRLCSLLRDSGIEAVAVEVDEDAPNVRLARGYEIPVVIGHGEDREILRRVHVDRARALAAVTSSDLTNVEVAVAARAARDSLEIVVRVREGDVAEETQTLVGLGHMKDIYEIAGVSLAGILSSASLLAPKAEPVRGAISTIG